MAFSILNSMTLNWCSIFSKSLNLYFFTSDFPFSFFVKTSFHSLSYENGTKEIIGISESDCAEECLYTPYGGCLSFDYYYPSSSCFIRTESKASLQQANLTSNKYYNYYEKLTGKVQIFYILLLSFQSISMH